MTGEVSRKRRVRLQSFSISHGFNWSQYNYFPTFHSIESSRSTSGKTIHKCTFKKIGLTAKKLWVIQNDEVSGESVRNWRSTLTRESLPVSFEKFTLTFPLGSNFVTVASFGTQDYQPLCRSVNHRVDLHEAGYEFRPPFYHSVECKHTSTYKNHQHHEHQDGSDVRILFFFRIWLNSNCNHLSNGFCRFVFYQVWRAFSAPRRFK